MKAWMGRNICHILLGFELEWIEAAVNGEALAESRGACYVACSSHLDFGFYLQKR